MSPVTTETGPCWCFCVFLRAGGVGGGARGRRRCVCVARGRARALQRVWCKHERKGRSSQTLLDTRGVSASKASPCPHLDAMRVRHALHASPPPPRGMQRQRSRCTMCHACRGVQVANNSTPRSTAVRAPARAGLRCARLQPWGAAIACPSPGLGARPGRCAAWWLSRARERVLDGRSASRHTTLKAH